MKKFFPAVALILLFAGLYIYQSQAPKELYSVSAEGFVSYENRPQIEYGETLLKDAEGLLVEKVTFRSRDAEVYGLLSLPKSDKKLPAFVVLPGAGVRKEAGLDGLARDLNDLGFVTITLDQRGMGETKAEVKSIEQDLGTFKAGGEPFQHKMFYDALRAADLLKSRKEVDSGKIYMAGESMGGRTAIVAAGIDNSIRGVLGISTSGYRFGQLPDEKAMQFVKSIDPDNYIGKISPRKIIMVHSANDTIIPYQFAQETFSKAGRPKEFFTTFEKGHGYDRKGTLEFLKKELEGWR